MAYYMITEAGMSPTLGNMDFASDYRALSPSTKIQIENEVRQTVESGRARATELLTTHRNELELVAKALLEYETLTLDEMKRVLQGEKLNKMDSSKGSGIKLPELVLPPGLGGTSNGSVAGDAGGGPAASGGTESGSTGGGPGGVKL